MKFSLTQGKVRQVRLFVFFFLSILSTNFYDPLTCFMLHVTINSITNIILKYVHILTWNNVWANIKSISGLIVSLTHKKIFYKRAREIVIAGKAKILSLLVTFIKFWGKVLQMIISQEVGKTHYSLNNLTMFLFIRYNTTIAEKGLCWICFN